MAARATELASVATKTNQLRRTLRTFVTFLTFLCVLCLSNVFVALVAQERVATRIVSLVPPLTEMLFAVGAGSQVIGVSSYDDFPPEVASRPRVGALLDPDTERILSLKPDLVIVYGSQTELEAQFKRVGIRVYSYRHGGIGHGIGHLLQTIRDL